MKSSENFFAGLHQHLEDQTRQEKILEKELETLPFNRETFGQQELQRIVEVKQYLNKSKDDFDREVEHLKQGSSEYVKVCDEHINQIMDYLDERSIWAHKFSTECSGGQAVGPLEITDDDSIYYVTPNMISLRLKRAERKSGLRSVIQPFHEKIVFTSEDGKEIITEPKLGYFVKEYATKAFMSLQRQPRIEDDFVSAVRVYYKGDTVYHVGTEEKTTRVHKGDRVNKMFDL